MITIMATANVHENTLTRTTFLSSYWKADMITPLEVITVLNEAKISFVLIGMYGLVGWMKEPRATQDVDLVVAARHLKKAVGLLTKAFRGLDPEDHEVVVRFREKDSGLVVIDVVKPTQPHLRVIFKNTAAATVGEQDYRVPSLEMALTLKFAPMISPNREDERKHQDAHDFIVMVKRNAEINVEKLAALGELVYGGGGRDLVEMVRKVRAGEKLVL